MLLLMKYIKLHVIWFNFYNYSYENKLKRNIFTFIYYSFKLLLNYISIFRNFLEIFYSTV